MMSPKKVWLHCVSSAHWLASPLREQVRLLDLLQALTQAGHAVIMSLNDLNHALAYCDHLLLLRQGRAIAGEARRIAGTERLSRLYGLPLSSVAGPRGTLMAPR